MFVLQRRSLSCVLAEQALGVLNRIAIPNKPIAFFFEPFQYWHKLCQVMTRHDADRRLDRALQPLNSDGADDDRAATRAL